MSCQLNEPFLTPNRTTHDCKLSYNQMYFGRRGYTKSKYVGADYGILDVAVREILNYTMYTPVQK